MPSKPLKICFFFPYHETSGVPVLFSRIANELANIYPEIEVSCIDYKDGAIARSVDSKVKIIQFEDGKKVNPPSDAILVLQSILPYSMRPELQIHKNTKIVFWTLHPDCLVPTLLPFPLLRNLQNKYFGFYEFLGKTIFKPFVSRVAKFAEILKNGNALWFMDQSNLDKTNKYLFLNFSNIDFLPVPSKGTALKINLAKRNENNFRFCWVGRLCDFKSHILIYTIRRLSKAAEAQQINVVYSVIGDGPFKSVIEKLDVNNKWFHLEILGSMNPDKLDEYLLNEVDVLTAMGTSALEGAKFAIPTILLDFTYFSISEDYQFRWLYQTKNFDLAHEISSDDILKGNNSLESMLSDLSINYSKISNNTYSYFIENHEISSFMELFLKKIANVSLLYGEIDPKLLKKGIVRSIYNKLRYRLA